MNLKNMMHGWSWVPLFSLCLVLVSCSDGAEETGDSQCPAGTERCGEVCVDTSSDPAHCGGCGLSCGAAERCEGGSCTGAEACPEEKTLCGETCVDLAADPMNCGGCGKTCAEGTVCSQGTCVGSCNEGETDCSGSCVNTETDRENCGGCGVVCPEGGLCNAGVCECPAGHAACDGVCIDVQEDDENCGRCGAVCPADQSCVAGKCACEEGYTDCDGVCVDTAHDAEHCGGCDQACKTPDHAVTTYCAEGQCGPVCEVGRLDCDGIFVNGCEISPATDPANCGGCGNDCAKLPGVEAATGCESGVCQFTCKENYGDCDEAPENGCETDLRIAVDHCSACNNSCNDLPNVAETKCDEGACTIVECQPGYGDCDEDPANGCEVDLSSDPDFCGSCATSCDIACVDGACVGVVGAAATGYNHTVVLTGDGRIFGWGANKEGQLGSTIFSSPTPIVGPSLSQVDRLSAGREFSCALLKDGTVWCWGNGANGKLGYGSTTKSTDPVQAIDEDGDFKDAVTISLGEHHACAATSPGELWCWGQGTDGKLGHGATTPSHRPILVEGLEDVVEVGAGNAFTCARTGTQGVQKKAVYCWGGNNFGQLGNGTTDKTNRPGDPVFLDAEKLAVGGSHACALDSEGKVFCWGWNLYQQSGAPGQNNILEPTEVPDAPKAKDIAAGTNFTCAISLEDELWCWGRNDRGQLGIGDESGSNHGPTKVTSLPAVRTISTRFEHACAVTPDEVVWCWGYNINRQASSIAQNAIAVPVKVEW